MTQPNDWENPQVTGIHREPAHATLLPFADPTTALNGDRSASPYFQLLNGIWKFHFAPNPNLAPADFYLPESDVSEWNDLPVPSNWQVQGYGIPRYLAGGYAFDYSNPPRVQEDTNETGSYRTTFTIPESWRGRQVFINFDGVDSAFYLWINGQMVGFSKDSRTAAEFNITSYLQPGQNLLVVRVYRWSDGSYLEDQDMWFLSGIFRDVFLFSTPAAHIRDFTVRTQLDTGYRDAALIVRAVVRNYNIETANLKVSAVLYDDAGQPLDEWTSSDSLAVIGGAEVEVTLSGKVSNPKKWSDEQPNLYTLLLTLEDATGQVIEVERCAVGFRQVEIRDGKVLVNGQGWRIEIKKYPRLTEVGAWRSGTLVGRMTHDQSSFPYDGIPHGGFYTQAQIRQVVEYARKRHVHVVPEIEIPGHAQAAIAAYPELGCDGPQEVARHWGVFTYDVFNPFESTFSFLKDVFNEVADLFPGEFVHVGGDEVRKQAWMENQDVQACKQALGMADEHALQSYFIRRVEAILQERGRRLVGWDEILEGGLAPSATVMSWRGEDGGIAAAKAGHCVVMAPNTYTYFDYYQSANQAAEPLAIGGYIPLSRVYSYNPIPDELTPEQAGYVLGTQFQLWSEYLTCPAQVEYMAFPRACALAEAAWSPQAARNWDGFTSRLTTHFKRLDGLQVNYRKEDWE